MENAARPWLLASASPRRAKILSSLGIPFVVRATDAPETAGTDPAATVKANALSEYRAAAAAADSGSFARILAADTIVALDGRIIASYSGSRTNIMGLPAERIAPYALADH